MNASTTAQTKPEPKPNEILFWDLLRPQGPVSHVSRLHGGDKPPSMRCIVDQLQSAVGCLENEFRRIARAGAAREELLRELLGAAAAKTAGDPVLLFAIACYEQLDDVRDALDSRAWATLTTNVAAYDEILGAFFAPDFRKSVAQQNFDTDQALAAADWPVFIERLEECRADPIATIPTGLESLDRILGGGLVGITFLAGAPGVGKSALALLITIAALRSRKDLGVLFFSLDMPKEIVFRRLLCAEANLTYRVLMGGAWDEETHQSLTAASKRLKADVLDRLRIVSALPKKGFTRNWLFDQAREFRRQCGCQQALVIVDHFQRLTVARRGTDLDADRYRIDVLEALQHATRKPAHPYGDPMLLISQVRKDAGAQNLKLADLLGAVDLTSRASNVLFLEPGSPPKRNGEVVEVTLQLAKGRDGTTRENIDLRFDFQRSRFAEARPAEERNKNDSNLRTAFPGEGIRIIT